MLPRFSCVCVPYTLKSGWVVYGPENGDNFPYPCLLRVKEWLTGINISNRKWTLEGGGDLFHWWRSGCLEPIRFSFYYLLLYWLGQFLFLHLEGVLDFFYAASPVLLYLVPGCPALIPLSWILTSSFWPSEVPSAVDFQLVVSIGSRLGAPLKMLFCHYMCGQLFSWSLFWLRTEYILPNLWIVHPL